MNACDFTPETIARFWSKVDKNGPVPKHYPELGPCWLWTSSINPNGYGYFTFNGHAKRECARAHRVAWIITTGTIGEHTVICHKCDVKTCCNPSHMFEGSQKQNVADAVSKGIHGGVNLNKGRMWIRTQGSLHPMARLNEDQVRQMRQMFKQGLTTQEAAKKYGISLNHAQDIKRRGCWRHIP